MLDSLLVVNWWFSTESNEVLIQPHLLAFNTINTVVIIIALTTIAYHNLTTQYLIAIVILSHACQ